jgi:hypothetical protein
LAEGARRESGLDQASAHRAPGVGRLFVKQLNAKLLRQFLQAAGEKLRGEWILVGGTLLPAVGLDIRSTVDIDLVGLGESEAAQTLELMELAESVGLSVETVNQAAAIFVKRAKVKPDELLPLVKGRSAQIFRPSLALYWRLKTPRMSESDLVDCQHYFHFCRAQKDTVDLRALLRQVEAEIKNAQRTERLPRLKVLLALATAV